MQNLEDYIIVPFRHPTSNKTFNNKKYATYCDICGLNKGYRIKSKSSFCSSCSAKKRIKKHGNSMQGKKHSNLEKFRPTYKNVDYDDYQVYYDKTGKKKRKYHMRCVSCNSDRGYKAHQEANRCCIKCHALKYTKKSKQHRKIYKSMKANINQRFLWRKIHKDAGIFRFLPYSLDDLINHLESQFEPWMNWDNHGAYTKDRMTWQIDHIIADSQFSYNSPTDIGFIKSWSLSNLRPLESLSNILKSNKN
jgi:hypothetical protein